MDGQMDDFIINKISRIPKFYYPWCSAACALSSQEFHYHMVISHSVKVGSSQGSHY